MKQQNFNILFILLFLIQCIQCQQCLSLEGSKACPLFNKASIQIGDSASEHWLAKVTNIDEFDQQVFNHVNTVAFWKQKLGCEIHNAPSYAISMTCAAVALSQASSICNPKNTTLPLCQSTCEAFSESIAQSTASNDTCSSAIVETEQRCKNDSAFSGLIFTGCISGYENELEICGKKK